MQHWPDTVGAQHGSRGNYLKTVRLSGTDLHFSRFIFGTASLFNVGTRRRRVALLHAAVHHGFTHFDTVPYYGFGQDYGFGQAERDLADLCRAEPTVTVTSKEVRGHHIPRQELDQMGAHGCRKVAGRVFSSITRPTIEFELRRARGSLEAR